MDDEELLGEPGGAEPGEQPGPSPHVEGFLDYGAPPPELTPPGHEPQQYYPPIPEPLPQHTNTPDLAAQFQAFVQQQKQEPVTPPPQQAEQKEDTKSDSLKDAIDQNTKAVNQLVEALKQQGNKEQPQPVSRNEPVSQPGNQAQPGNPPPQKQSRKERAQQAAEQRTAKRKAARLDWAKRHHKDPYAKQVLEEDRVRQEQAETPQNQNKNVWSAPQDEAGERPEPKPKPVEPEKPPQVSDKKTPEPVTETGASVESKPADTSNGQQAVQSAQNVQSGVTEMGQEIVQALSEVIQVNQQTLNMIQQVKSQLSNLQSQLQSLQQAVSKNNEPSDAFEQRGMA